LKVVQRAVLDLGEDNLAPDARAGVPRVHEDELAVDVALAHLDARLLERRQQGRSDVPVVVSNHDVHRATVPLERRQPVHRSRAFDPHLRDPDLAVGAGMDGGQSYEKSSIPRR
jgi:hypothetical protein